MITNCTVNILEKKSLIYEGEPPGDLNLSLIFDVPACFKVVSLSELEDEGNTITITGVYDDTAVVEILTCSGFISNTVNKFDSVSSFVFDFEDVTNITIESVTEMGDINPVNQVVAWGLSVSAHIQDLRWSLKVQELGVIIEKSKLLRIPVYIDISNNNVIEYAEETYEIKSIDVGQTMKELIITRIDN